MKGRVYKNIEHIFFAVFIALIIIAIITYYYGYNVGNSSAKNVENSLKAEILSQNSTINNLESSLNNLSKAENLSQDNAINKLEISLNNLSNSYKQEINEYNTLLNQYIQLNKTNTQLNKLITLNANLTIFGNYSFTLPSFSNSTQLPGSYSINSLYFPYNGYVVIYVYGADNCGFPLFIIGGYRYGDGQIMDFNGNNYCIDLDNLSETYLFTQVSSGYQQLEFNNYDNNSGPLKVSITYIATFNK